MGINPSIGQSNPVVVNPTAGLLVNIELNCGEYAPGLEPINLSSICPPIPPILIPGGSEPDVPDIPSEPDTPYIPGRPRIPTDPQPPTGGGVDPPTTGGGGGTGGGPRGGTRPPTTQPVDPGNPITPGGSTQPPRPRIPTGPTTPGGSTGGGPITPGGSTEPPGTTIPDPGEAKPEPPTGPTTPGGGNPKIPKKPTEENPLTRTGVINPLEQVINIENTIVFQTPEIININTEALNNIENVIPVSANSIRSIYNPDLNIFRSTPSPTTEIVTNILYPEIFSYRVANEVKYLIDNQNSINPWSDRIIQDLTLDKIRLSINPTLLEAFNNIHNPGGTRVPESSFIETIRSHLLMGTLNEFDPSFYINTANKQKNDNFVVLQKDNTRSLNEIYSLNILSTESTVADTSSYSTNYNQRQLRRQRRLNDDVNMRIPICMDGEEIPYHIPDSGIRISTSDSCLFLETGEGDGYYFNLSTEDGCIDFPTLNDSSSVVYPCQGTRFNSLINLNSTPDITITVESTSSHELIPGDIPFYPSLPVYLKLELSSVSSSITQDPLINRTVARYYVLSSQTDIDNHTNSNGFAVSRINIDYRDPMYRYIRSSKVITLDQNDITLRAFDTNKTIINSKSLSRTIPLGLVVTPVMGSKFNPFNGRSKISNVGDTVTRTLSLKPSFEFSDNDVVTNQLTEASLYLTNGSSTSIGLVEEFDTQNVTYRFVTSAQNLTETFISGSTYVSSAPLASAYGTAFMVNTVIDTLTSSYNGDKMLWFDVYRRMPLKRFGELLYDGSKTYMNMLSNGHRNDVKLVHSLNRLYSDLSLLEDDDMVVMTKREKYAKSN